jgi:Flp pilus assembly secretin CpaC
MRTLYTVSTALAASMCLFAASSAQAQAISLDIDQSKPIRFTTPITGVVVGNAGIADVIVHDTKTLFVIGKAVGTTHVLAVDQRGRTVFSGEIAVRASDVNGLLTVQRGREISTSICDQRCVASAGPESTASGMSDAVARAKARSAFASGGGN